MGLDNLARTIRIRAEGLAVFLEVLALPLPGDLMLSYTGLYVYEEKMNWILSILSAGAGAAASISLSYWIGYRLGKPFIIKYGHRIHLGEEQLSRITVWFEKYGAKLLFIAYFIPGLKHITGYFCGVTRMPFRRYAIFAYTGGLFWSVYSFRSAAYSARNGKPIIQRSIDI